MEIFGYEKLKVWQESMNLVDEIYQDTRTFPKSELFGLGQQMRGSAVSVPSNIAEGFGREGLVYLNHLGISRGSVFELRTQIEIARRQQLIDPLIAEKRMARATEVSKMLDGLIKSRLQKRPPA